MHLLELGADKSIIELWHHEVDAREKPLMDWICTPSYCSALAKHFQIPLYFSYREGGFRKEMLRSEEPTAAVHFQTPTGWEKSGGKSQKLGTRNKFPQQSASLAVRWCSAYLKIGVCDVAIAHQPRFIGKRTLFVSGERAEESAARSKYAEFESHRKHAKSRHIDHWRPVINWKTQEIWEIIERHKIVAHPAYHLGFGRTSCRGCIFISDKDWRTNLDMGDDFVANIASYEDKFGITIARPSSKGAQNVLERAMQVKEKTLDPSWVEKANSSWHPTEPIITDLWKMPAGAFASLSGGSP